VAIALSKAHYGYEEHSEQMNFAMPLVFSSKMYGIHFDNPTTGFLDLDSKRKICSPMKA
jgi:hypothetical protein